MTDKELRKLKRTELLELMLYLRKELDTVKQENEDLRSQLEAHSVGQDNVNNEILRTVQKAAKQIDQMYQSQGLETESPEPSKKDSEDPKESANESADTEETGQ